jgi:ankyrin repeat protein
LDPDNAAQYSANLEEFLVGIESLDYRDEYGKTPLHHACYNAGRQIVIQGAIVRHKVLETSETIPKYKCICRHDHVELVELILQYDQGIKTVNVADCNGNTPLLLACKSGCIGVVRLLLKYVKSINRPNHKGKTPMSVAQKHGHAPIVKLLRQHSICQTQCSLM